MVTRKVKKQETGLDEAELIETFEQWSTVKSEVEELGKRQGVLRQRIVDRLEQFGETDDKGHKRLRLSTVVDGFVTLKYERRVRRVLDPDTAEKVLAKKRLLKQCQTTITVLDEDKIEALMYQGKISDEEYALIFPQTESWAFKPEKS